MCSASIGARAATCDAAGGSPISRRVIVTGAAGSIGRAVVNEFRNHGHRVLGIDVQPAPADLELDEYHQFDLGLLARSLPEERQGLLSAVARWSSQAGLDVLVNSAAVQVLGPLEDLDVDAWQSSLGVNLLAPFFLVKDLLPALERVQGSVVNVSSIHARATKPEFVAYATTKAALSGMTRAMAVELGPRVRVNAIEPASILTPMLMASFEESPAQLQELAACHPQKRIGTPQEVASLIHAVALGDFKFLHGECIDLSGGVSVRLHDPL